MRIKSASKEQPPAVISVWLSPVDVSIPSSFLALSVSLSHFTFLITFSHKPTMAHTPNEQEERERERSCLPRRRRRLCGAHGSLSIILYGHIKVIYGPPCATHTHINKWANKWTRRHDLPAWHHNFACLHVWEEMQRKCRALSVVYNVVDLSGASAVQCRSGLINWDTPTPQTELHDFPVKGLSIWVETSREAYTFKNLEYFY
jgi:hypothetical protein